MFDLEQKVILPDDGPEESQGDVEEMILDWDIELENRTLRKFDKYLLPPLAVILLLAYLDRSNLGMFAEAGRVVSCTMERC